MKIWSSPFSLSASGVISARLHTTLCGVNNTVNLTVANGTGANAGKATLTVPAQATLGRGVWTLTVISSCGCYILPVFVNACQPPSVAPDDGDNADDGDEPIPTCDDTDDTSYCPVFGC